MSEPEIALTRAYLASCHNDPVAALIRSVRDLVRLATLAREGTVALPPRRRRPRVDQA